jgi:hypothetical protein
LCIALFFGDVAFGEPLSWTRSAAAGIDHRVMILFSLFILFFGCMHSCCLLIFYWVETGCNWYMHDINIFLFIEKENDNPNGNNHCLTHYMACMSDSCPV